MSKLVLRKGNLFHPLENRIDFRLIDSSQYDLEINIDGEIKYYRIRYDGSYYGAKEITPESFIFPKYSQYGVQAREVDSFCKTELYRTTPIYKKTIGAEKRGYFQPSYYAFLQRITSKNNLNNVRTLYKFSVPALGNREKIGVLSYDIQVELIRNRYYVIFITENVARGYTQRVEPQYVVYDKKEFQRERKSFEDAVLNLAIAGDYPLNLLEYVYTMTGGNEDLIAQFFYDLKRAKGLSELQYSSLFPILSPKAEMDEEIKKEITRYISGEQEDIHYTYGASEFVLKK